MVKAARAAALTLIELLVVMGVVGLLVALLLPAVQRARGQALQVRCAQQLRQFGIAIHLYNEAFACLPMGRYETGDARLIGPDPKCTNRWDDKSAHLAVLPYLEQANVYDIYNNHLHPFSPENRTVRGTWIASFLCPADGSARLGSRVKPGFAPVEWVEPNEFATTTNYVLNFSRAAGNGNPAYVVGCKAHPKGIAQLDGVFNDLRPLRLKDISDGLTSTIFGAERGLWDFLLDPTDPNTGSVAWWFSGNLNRTLFLAILPPQRTDPSIPLSLGLANTATSWHGSGAYVLFGDNSVRFITDKIDSWPVDGIYPRGATLQPGIYLDNLPPNGIWQSLFTRNGGETGLEGKF